MQASADRLKASKLHKKQLQQQSPPIKTDHKMGVLELLNSKADVYIKLAKEYSILFNAHLTNLHISLTPDKTYDHVNNLDAEAREEYKRGCRKFIKEIDSLSQKFTKFVPSSISLEKSIKTDKEKKLYDWYGNFKIDLCFKINEPQFALMRIIELSNDFNINNKVEWNNENKRLIQSMNLLIKSTNSFPKKLKLKSEQKILVTQSQAVTNGETLTNRFPEKINDKIGKNSLPEELKKWHEEFSFEEEVKKWPEKFSFEEDLKKWHEECSFEEELKKWHEECSLEEDLKTSPKRFSLPDHLKEWPDEFLLRADNSNVSLKAHSNEEK